MDRRVSPADVTPPDGRPTDVDRLQLSRNENPLGPSPRAVAAVRAAASGMHRYPARPHAALEDAIASRWGVEPAQVWLGAGAVSVIDCLVRACVEPGAAVLCPDPGFGYFGTSASAHRGHERTYPLDRDRAFALDVDALLAAYDGESIVFINTPHNPTGATVPLEAVEAVLAGTDSGTVVAVDEAYGPFTDAPSAIDRVDDTDRLAVIRSLSKAHGLAGARLGYGVVPADLAPAYDELATPFGVASLACVAGLASLADDAHLARSVAVARRGRGLLRERLDVPTWPSAGNFVLASVGDAGTVTEDLSAAGLEVRDCTAFGLPACIRITTGTTDQSRRAAAIVNRVVA